MTGEQLKLEGQLLVEANNATFVETMRTIARGRAILNGAVCIDDLRQAAEKAGLKPTHPNAFGAIFKGPGWVVIGRKPSTWPSSHGREIKVWRYEH